MPASRVVIVEDADPIRLSVRAALSAHGYDTIARRDGEDLESLLAEHPPELVILDVMLPGRDGLELLELVRARSTAGVLLLTARDTTADRVDGLARGADDYLVKPFAMAELLARVQAILRRVGVSGPSIAVGDLEIADGGAQVRRAGVSLELTDTERRLLVYLAGQRGRTVTKTQLLTGVWGYDGFDPNVVEVHVSALRRKLEANGPRLIHTVRGRGYRLAEAP
ncbi:MAG: response regulator transcription factor [Actinomycetota bacterium]|nr:response regulator transcription factor [Actinomycetota bacterium]